MAIFYMCTDKCVLFVSYSVNMLPKNMVPAMLGERRTNLAIPEE